MHRSRRGAEAREITRRARARPRSRVLASKCKSPAGKNTHVARVERSRLRDYPRARATSSSSSSSPTVPSLLSSSARLLSIAFPARDRAARQEEAALSRNRFAKLPGLRLPWPEFRGEVSHEMRNPRRSSRGRAKGGREDEEVEEDAVQPMNPYVFCACVHI